MDRLSFCQRQKWCALTQNNVAHRHCQLSLFHRHREVIWWDNSQEWEIHKIPHSQLMEVIVWPSHNTVASLLTHYDT
jgi:hypothetical protein